MGFDKKVKSVIECRKYFGVFFLLNEETKKSIAIVGFSQSVKSEDSSTNRNALLVRILRT